ncbi:MAG: type II toxin-antitoxin system ParD family antitoxin [Ruaniaceae bacterium]|nr:type II toxin-antitoxin system ParD family antitoxin [Ruaniaceae bacterium]
MRTTKQLSITLPNNMADALKERVTSGAYASESEVIRDGLRALFSQEEAIERWLRTEITVAYDELRADRSKAISSKDMRTHLAAVHEQRVPEGGSA